MVRDECSILTDIQPDAAGVRHVLEATGILRAFGNQHRRIPPAERVSHAYSVMSQRQSSLRLLRLSCTFNRYGWGGQGKELIRNLTPLHRRVVLVVFVRAFIVRAKVDCPPIEFEEPTK